MSSKVLLTGGAGFIGAGLAATLVDRGFELDIVDNLSRGVDDVAFRKLVTSGRARFHNVDLLSPDALDGFGNDFDFVVHLAAILGVRRVTDHPYQTLRDNVLLQEAAIAFAARQKHLQRLLFASTSEVYAGSVMYLKPTFPMREDAPLALPPPAEPRTSYMMSKIYGEAMLMHSGIPYTIVRPHNVYGARMGMSHLIPEFLARVHRALEGGSVELYSPDHTRTFCFIDDAVEMLTRLLRSGAACNQIVNLGAEGPEYTIRQVAQIMIAVVGKKLTLDERPPTPGSPGRRVPSMAKTTELTGYAAQVPLTEGVRRTYDWYKRNVFAA